ncbi:hypothetical protein ACIQPR_32060 [Streptomyces sp. NPDC091280]
MAVSPFSEQEREVVVGPGTEVVVGPRTDRTSTASLIAFRDAKVS